MAKFTSTPGLGTMKLEFKSQIENLQPSKYGDDQNSFDYHIEE